MLLIAIPAAISPPAHATPTYTPGVKVGDSVTFGQIVLNYNHTSGVPQGLQLFNDTKSITETVKAVDLVAKTVTMTQTFLLKNMTSLTMTLSGNVQNGNGNLSIFISAGGLSAGEPLTQSSSGSSSFFGFIGETVTRSYAGALRPANAVSFGSMPQSGINGLAFYWDQSTGFLLEASESVAVSTYNPQPFAIDIRVTSTNIWPTLTAPDFSLDATSQTSPFVFQGASGRIALNLTSYNGFTGTASLTTTLLNSSIVNHPTITLSQTNPAIPNGGSGTSLLTFASTATMTLGLYLFTVNATSGSQHHGAEFALLVVPPDFEVVSTPSSVSIAPGGVKTTTVTVRALGVFTGTVDLSASGTNLVKASLNRTSLTLTQSVVSVNSTLTISSSPYSLPSTLNVYVDGTSSSVTRGFGSHTAYVPVTISGPDFQISIGANTLSILPGGTGSTSITLSSLGGFVGQVGLTASSYDDFAISFSPSAVVLSSGSTGQTKLTIGVPSGKPSGFYGVSITGASGLLTRYGYVSVNVASRDYQISADPYQITLQRGKTVNANITVTSLNGFAGTLSLAANSYNIPIGFVLNPTSVTLTAGQSAKSQLTFSIPSTITLQSYYVTVFAYNATSSRATSVNLTPQFQSTPPPTAGPDFAVSAAPSSLALSRGGTANSTISLSSLSGFKGSLTLTASLAYLYPPCTVNCLTPTLSTSTVVLTAGGTATSGLSVYAPPGLSPGYYPVVVTATNGTIFRSTTVYVTVVVPDFGIFLNIDSLTILQGGTVTPTVIVESLDNFSGALSLTANVTAHYGVCPGINCPVVSLSPMIVSVSSNGTSASMLSITASSSTPPGSYESIVTATNGTVARYFYLNFQVAGPDFQVSNSYPLVLAPGGSGVASISVASQNGFAGTVTLTPSGGYGINVNTAPVNVTVSSGGWVTHVFSVSTVPTTVPGSYGFNVNGVNGPLSSGTFVQVVVAAPDFGVALNETYLTIQAGGSANVPIIIPSYDGLSGVVQIVAHAAYGPAYPLCPGTSCPTISVSPATVVLASGGWSASGISLSFPTSAVPGSYSVIVNATGGSVSHTQYLNIQVTPPPATLLSVAVGSDGALYWSRLAGAWTSWQNLGGSSSSQPGLCSSGPGNAELVVRGNDNGIYHKTFTGGSWTNVWDSPGGATIDQPACAVLNSIVYIVVRGSDNGLYANAFEFGFWIGWTSLSGATQSPPVLVASPQSNRIDLLVRGMNNGIFHKALIAGTWSNTWDSPGGSTIDTPSVTSDGFSLYLAVRGTDNGAYYNVLPFSGGWSGWTSLGGVVISAPTITIDAGGTVHVVVRGLDNGIYLKAKPILGSWTPSWGLPIGYTLNQPEAQVIGSNLYLLVRGSDNSIYYDAFIGFSWTGWLTLGGSTHLEPSLSTN